MPDDIEGALLSDLGPAYRENHNLAKHQWSLDELHPWEAWRFVIRCTNEFGQPADPCCCCARETAQGAYELMETEHQFRRAVVATVQNHPGWIAPD